MAYKDDNFLQRTDLARLLLRLCFGGLMMILHGFPKLQNLLAGGPYKFPDPLGMGVGFSLGFTVFAEFACAFLIVIGLFTRWASFPLVLTMLVAIFVIHWADPLGDKELALVYLFGYVCILLAGPGRYSVDDKLAL